MRPVGKLMGTVSEADSSGSRRVVIRITQKQWVMPGQGGQRGQAPAGGQAGGDNHISLDPATIQATLVVIAKRGTGALEAPAPAAIPASAASASNRRIIETSTPAAFHAAGGFRFLGARKLAGPALAINQAIQERCGK